jgi:hypothetical protein
MTSLPQDLQQIIDGYYNAPMTYFDNKDDKYLNKALAGFLSYKKKSGLP